MKTIFYCMFLLCVSTVQATSYPPERPKTISGLATEEGATTNKLIFCEINGGLMTLSLHGKTKASSVLLYLLDEKNIEVANCELKGEQEKEVAEFSVGINPNFRPLHL